VRPAAVDQSVVDARARGGGAAAAAAVKSADVAMTDLSRGLTGRI